jgi:hypothetical protein
VFGLDETSKFDDKGLPVDTNTGSRAPDKRYVKYPNALKSFVVGQNWPQGASTTSVS